MADALMEAAALLRTATATHRVDLPVKSLCREVEPRKTRTGSAMQGNPGSETYSVTITTKSQRKIVVGFALTDTQAKALCAKLEPVVFGTTSATVDCTTAERNPVVMVRVAELLAECQSAGPDDVFQFMLVGDNKLQWRRVASWQPVSG